MNQKRILKGNQTTLPAGSELLTGAFQTQAIPQIEELGKGNVPLSNDEFADIARDFSKELKL